MKLTTKSLFKLTLITPNGDQWDNDELITFKSLCNHLDFKWDDTEDQTMLLKSALLDSKSNLKKGHHGIRIHKSYDWYDIAIGLYDDRGKCFTDDYLNILFSLVLSIFLFSSILDTSIIATLLISMAWLYRSIKE